MNLIEISKAPKDLCINSFKENILNNFSLEYVSKLSSSGQLGLKYLRGMVWKILLGVLPPNDSLEKWKEKIIYLRKEYKIISDKIKKKQNYFEEKEKNEENFINNDDIDINISTSRRNTVFHIVLDFGQNPGQCNGFHKFKIKYFSL